MTIISWSQESQEDLKRLYEFVLECDVVAAEKVLLAIEAGARNLSDWPHIGHRLRGDASLREKLIPFGDGEYVLRYRINEADRSRFAVKIVRIWHSRESRF